MSDEYLLAVGKEGAARLSTVQELYGDESKMILAKAGLHRNMTVMDVGCGTGLMTHWLADQVGGDGKIIAVDNSQSQLDFAKKHLVHNKIHNVNYLCKSIDDLSYADLHSIDLIYARLILVHNKNPLIFINQLKEQCKKNTIFVFEEPVTSESGCYPVQECFKKHIALYCDLGKRAGFDYDFGEKLPSLASTAGLSIKGVRKVQNYYLNSKSKLIAYQRTKECANKYLNEKMISPSELNILLTQLLELANKQDILISGVNMMQIWGTI
ncbi:class I SAM-dependent methyltransferase [Legionella sp. km535]|uniref:class I SAM-dependent methyltransferase n=1 Tax=Legionella sp. km535 TaxID=2498107 RepID=UPI000F8DB206|nr:class I SAM-dependent methyltransferase [Legionella sp. km535]RUR15407.1 class I SAM-dependent methyltransferase [Legionella sp. km535]